MHLRKISAIAAVTLTAGVLAACGGSSRGDDTTTAAAPAASGNRYRGGSRLDGRCRPEPVRHHRRRRLVDGRPARLRGRRGVRRRQPGRPGHGRHLRHRWRLREVLRRRDRHLRRLPPDQGRGEGRLRADNGIKFDELQVANDGIAVVVNKENDWAKCLTVEQLKTIWGPDSQGRQLEPGRPVASRTRRSTLYGPGTDSGTFDYFTAAINGEEGASRTDYYAVRGRQRHRPGRRAATRAASATSASPTSRRTRTS